VVVSPLIALICDQVEALNQLGVRAEVLNSSLTKAQIRGVEQELLKGLIDLVYVSPEKLLDGGIPQPIKPMQIEFICH
jgi:ATP-dependent DNA helicase RecQ